MLQVWAPSTNLAYDEHMSNIMIIMMGILWGGGLYKVNQLAILGKLRQENSANDSNAIERNTINSGPQTDWTDGYKLQWQAATTAFNFLSHMSTMELHQQLLPYGKCAELGLVLIFFVKL